MKMKTLVVTKRTPPPMAIAKCLEALGNETPTVSTELQPTAPSIQRILEAEKPKLIFIDGNYNSTDEALWKKLSKLSAPDLRLQLLSGRSANPLPLPASLNLLMLLRALKKDDMSIVIFIDRPSKHVKQEVRQLGATIVWERLNSITNTEASLLKILQGVKLAGAGVSGMLKEIFKKE